MQLTVQEDVVPCFNCVPGRRASRREWREPGAAWPSAASSCVAQSTWQLSRGLKSLAKRTWPQCSWADGLALTGAWPHASASKLNVPFRHGGNSKNWKWHASMLQSEKSWCKSALKLLSLWVRRTSCCGHLGRHQPVPFLRLLDYVLQTVKMYVGKQRLQAAAAAPLWLLESSHASL